MAAIMLVVALLTVAGLSIAARSAVAGAERELHAEFRAALDALNTAREVRALHLAQRCRLLVENSRIHAALEDDALDLLYISARDELSDLMAATSAAGRGSPVRARFYRFLDARGSVILPPNDYDAGAVSRDQSSRLGLSHLPVEAQIGFIPQLREGADGGEIDEVVTTPIVSTESNRAIAALVVGLATEISTASPGRNGIRRGLWVEGHLDLAGVSAVTRSELAQAMTALFPVSAAPSTATTIEAGGRRFLLLGQPLNRGSLYPAAFEVFLYPLDASAAEQSRVRWEILGGGALFLLVGMVASHLIAVRLSRPVERLAIDSEANATERSRAEAALELTQAELERSARFSANASHQLKTPVAVLRAGLDELLARDDLPPAIREELVGLVGETTRFTGMIEELLLLSRMDAGRVRIEFLPVDLVHLVESCLDDFSVLPDPFELDIITRLPQSLEVAGEKRYLSHVLQNLVENARNYNRARGRIEIALRTEGAMAILSIGNTGRSIPRSHQAHLFDRFHRGAAAENLPGHGLGLNLARELVRLHRGELRLATSVEDWTEFQVSFPLAIENSSL